MILVLFGIRDSSMHVDFLVAAASGSEVRLVPRVWHHLGSSGQSVFLDAPGTSV